MSCSQGNFIYAEYMIHYGRDLGHQLIHLSAWLERAPLPHGSWHAGNPHGFSCHRYHLCHLQKQHKEVKTAQTSSKKYEKKFPNEVLLKPVRRRCTPLVAAASKA